MNIDIIFTITLAGITLGFVEGVKPGPLLTMVIRETLSGGLKAGSKAALAPVFTDGPMIILSLIFAGWVSNQPLILIIISYLAITTSTGNFALSICFITSFYNVI